MLDDLQERVYQLQTELAVANQLVEENRQLRELLELAPPPGWHRMAALMIARDPILWNQRFRIDRGRVDGVLVGSLVMAGEQVVGRVVEISAASALVATLADPECRLSVRLPDSGATGLLYGGRDFQSESGRIVALIDYLPRDDVYSEGGLVETSGLSGFVPGGIEVGRIVAWNDQQVVELVDASFARLRVLPSVDLSGVRVVSVLLPAGG